MKRLLLLITVITLLPFNTFSQNVPVNEPDHNKSKLFDGQPDHITVSSYKLNSLFDFLPGQKININLSDGSLFQFEGEMVSVSSKYGNTIQTVIFSSSNYKDARLTISRYIDESGAILYRGRILSLQHGDVYELQNHQGKYTLQKRNLYDLLNE